MPFLLGTIIAGFLFACESETPPPPEPELIIKNQNPPLDIKGEIIYDYNYPGQDLSLSIVNPKTKLTIKETGRVGINQPWGSNPADTLMFK